jgi:hypothetical protein
VVPPGLGAVHVDHGTPSAAIGLVTAFTAAGPFLGDALLVPISEVGSLAAGVGWCAASLAFLVRQRRAGLSAGTALAVIGAVVSVGIILMKVIPVVPGSFTRAEWIALAGWCGLGLALWTARPRGALAPE